jgi:CDP-glucose 4,6-dehydratase
MEGLVMLNPSFWSGRRVLVTGDTGFKGSWLSFWLLELGAEVWGYSLPPEGSHSLSNELSLTEVSGHFHRQFGDLRNLQALHDVVEKAQPEVVLHLAAQPIVRRSYRDPLGTWATNVNGSLHVLEALKTLLHPCAVVMVTTDKVYANQEWDYGYREVDRLGGHDPYSASKAAAELAISSWRSSFCGREVHQTPHLAIATVRAGNVIGGGDWAEERIFPDAMRSLALGEAIPVRQPNATRPWQHVLEPLGGYLLLAEKLATDGQTHASSFNFGPMLESNRSVRELVDAVLKHWPGTWSDLSDSAAPHESARLHLQIDKAHHQLGWKPRWSFNTTVQRSVAWYQAVHEGATPLECCVEDLRAYERELAHDC